MFKIYTLDIAVKPDKHMCTFGTWDFSSLIRMEDEKKLGLSKPQQEIHIWSIGRKFRRKKLPGKSSC